GDRTFAINNTFPHEYDLAVEWKKLTGLPFAFAAWTSHSEINDPEFLESFNNALAMGVANTGKSLEGYQNTIESFDPYNYLTQKISHQLDQPKREAINRFLSFLAQ
ncbi:MAG TPA: MqnA/MqnD/SBP family protein, partial [Bacteroidia bacterium]